jgi:ankyrin repeat protein
MQALQKKKAEEQKMRDLLAKDETKSLEQRIERCRVLQFEEHQAIFATSYSTIHKAAADNSIEGLKHFLNPSYKPKVHIDDYDKHGFCPIHAAATKGSNHSIKFIVEYGCDVNIRSTYGDTALMIACKESHLPSIKLLFSLGANPELSNKAGKNGSSCTVCISSKILQ